MNSHSSGFAENIFVLINHVLCNLSYSIFFNIHSSYWSKQVVIHVMINFQSLTQLWMNPIYKFSLRGTPAFVHSF